MSWRIEGRVKRRVKGRVKGRVSGRVKGRVKRRAKGRITGRIKGHVSIRFVRQPLKFMCPLILRAKLHLKFPPSPHRILQGGGVPGPGIAFRFLNLKPGDSDSANCLGQTITFGKRWRRVPPPQ